MTFSNNAGRVKEPIVLGRGQVWSLSFETGKAMVQKQLKAKLLWCPDGIWPPDLPFVSFQALLTCSQ